MDNKVYWHSYNDLMYILLYMKLSAECLFGGPDAFCSRWSKEISWGNTYLFSRGFSPIYLDDALLEWRRMYRGHTPT